MRVFAEVTTVGLVKAGHWFNVGDIVQIDPEAEHDIYYPARRVTDGALQHLKECDFEIMKDCNYG